MTRASLLAVAGLLLAAAFGAPAHARTGDDPVDEDWRDLLSRAVEAGRERAYEGRLVVITFERDGPVVGEVTVSQNQDGSLVASPAEAWRLEQHGGRTAFDHRETSTLLRLGGQQLRPVSLDRLARKYRVEIAGTASGPAGGVTVVQLRERGSETVRERLYIDADSGVLVRRETYDRDGRPQRLTSFASITFRAQELPPIEGRPAHTVEAAATEVSTGNVAILRDVGWVVPEELPEGFALVDAFAVGEDEGSSLHLFYSDGLYSLSVYEQHGRLDGSALTAEGARPTTLGGMRAYRWPGEQPATYVWTGDGLTFTAVSDAPTDTLASALAGMPHERPPRLVDRLARGARRVLDWAWPFS